MRRSSRNSKGCGSGNIKGTGTITPIEESDGSSIGRISDVEEIEITGGEPILDPKLPTFLSEIPEEVKEVRIYVSLQFPKEKLSQMMQWPIPLEKVVLVHTSLTFNEDPNMGVKVA